MTRLSLGLVAIFSLAAAPAAAQPTSGFDAEELAAAVRANLPQTFAGGVQLVETWAEGPLLVARITGPGEALRALGSQGLSAAFAEGFCRGPGAPAMFAAGLRMRMDAQAEDGTLIRGIIVDRCPPPRRN